MLSLPELVEALQGQLAERDALIAELLPKAEAHERQTGRKAVSRVSRDRVIRARRWEKGRWACGYCDATITKAPHTAGRPRAYCSPECAKEAVKAAYAARRHKTCVTCGTQLPSERRVYCSEPCQRYANRKTHTPEELAAARSAASMKANVERWARLDDEQRREAMKPAWAGRSATR